MQLGLAPQGISPIAGIPITTGAEFAGRLIGVRSYKLARYRSLTGGVSISSPASNVIEYNNTSGTITIPAIPPDQSDYWLIYVSPSGFGNVGFHSQIPTDNDINGILESQIANGTVDISGCNIHRSYSLI